MDELTASGDPWPRPATKWCSAAAWSPSNAATRARERSALPNVAISVPGDEVHARVLGEQRPQRSRGVDVAEREGGLDHEDQLHRPLRLVGATGELAVQQVVQGAPDAGLDPELCVQGEQPGYPPAGERLAAVEEGRNRPSAPVSRLIMNSWTLRGPSVMSSPKVSSWSRVSLPNVPPRRSRPGGRRRNGPGSSRRVGSTAARSSQRSATRRRSPPSGRLVADQVAHHGAEVGRRAEGLEVAARLEPSGTPPRCARAGGPPRRASCRARGWSSGRAEIAPRRPRPRARSIARPPTWRALDRLAGQRQRSPQARPGHARIAGVVSVESQCSRAADSRSAARVPSNAGPPGRVLEPHCCGESHRRVGWPKRATRRSRGRAGSGRPARSRTRPASSSSARTPGCALRQGRGPLEPQRGVLERQAVLSQPAGLAAVAQGLVVEARGCGRPDSDVRGEERAMCAAGSVELPAPRRLGRATACGVTVACGRARPAGVSAWTNE